MFVCGTVALRFQSLAKAAVKTKAQDEVLLYFFVVFVCRIATLGVLEPLGEF